MATPAKSPNRPRSQMPEASRTISENSDPNVPLSPPLPAKAVKSPAFKPTAIATAATPKKSATRTPGRILAAAVPAPPPPARERKFIFAKKKGRRASKVGLDFGRRRQDAYDALRASQEEFFRKDLSSGVVVTAAAFSAAVEPTTERSGGEEPPEVKDKKVETREVCDSVKDQDQDHSSGLASTGGNVERDGGKKDDIEVGELESSANVRKMRSPTMGLPMGGSMPEPGSGRVKHLVKAFENLLTISNENEEEKSGERKMEASSWVLQKPEKKVMAEDGPVSVFSSAEFATTRNLEKDSKLYSSFDSNGDRFSWASGTSGAVGGRRIKRNSSELLRGSWNKKLKVTSQHPFKLRTEQRGRVKEARFISKVKEMLTEEERKRIPIAQGLPWTTDEPECLVKPPVKEITEPIDIVLHSDVRAVERSEFDNHVAEKLSFVEQLRLEREMQRKLEEEEEVRRLRKELVPKAQPMPYFDRPFVPKKSERPRTIPKEPRFHIRPVKSSWRKGSCGENTLDICRVSQLERR